MENMTENEAMNKPEQSTSFTDNNTSNTEVFN